MSGHLNRYADCPELRIERLGARLLCITDVPRQYFAWYEGIPRHRIYQLDL